MKIKMENVRKIVNPDNDPRFKQFGILGLGVVGIMIYYVFICNNEISYNEFTDLIKKDQINQIEIVSQNVLGGQKIYANIFLDNNEQKRIVIGNVNQFLERLEKLQFDKSKLKQNFINVVFKNGKEYEKIIHFFLDNLGTIMFAATVFIMYKSYVKILGNFGQGKTMGLKKSQFKVYGIDKKIETRFKDVAGQDEAKQEIQEFVQFLKNPQDFNKLGARIPKGALLTGPPGTGKTLLAKAVAGEAGVPFYTVSGSEFVEMFAGIGASRVRDLFKQAKETSPSIIFIDEIDAIGKKRAQNGRSHEEKDNTLNQLLVEMDGFNSDNNVVVLAATNQKDVLDPALTRPGRLDRQVEVGLSDIQGRRDIFMVHLAKLKLNPQFSIIHYANRLATLTPGFSGADIANLCNEAAIQAARTDSQTVNVNHFEIATERIIGGLEKKGIVNLEQRKVVAVHESGHAVVSWFLEGCMPLLKLTIIPRSKGSLGFAQYLPSESGLLTKQELMNQITFILGGRVAEQHFFNQITTGAYDDLIKAHKIAYNIVTKFGMTQSIGLRGFKSDQFSKNYSEYTQEIIDQQIKIIIQEATEKCKETVVKYQQQIQLLSQALLEKETLDLNQITQIIGQRPFPPQSNFKEYLEIKKSDENFQQSN